MNIQSIAYYNKVLQTILNVFFFQIQEIEILRNRKKYYAAI